MNQQKTGEFLKQLRKERGLTQEELAEKFFVSSRTVSRWETGSNLPDLSMLIDLAEYYDVDIREIINGERKSEMMDSETKDTLKKVAEYVERENQAHRKKMIEMLSFSAILLVFCALLYDTRGFYGAIAESACQNMILFSLGITLSAVGLTLLYLLGVFDKISRRKFSRREGKK